MPSAPDRARAKDGTSPAPWRHRLIYLRVAVTLMAWAAAVIFGHSLVHAYAAELSAIIASPLSRGMAITVALTALVYFVVLSLPGVPNLNPRSVLLVFIWIAALVLGHSLSHAGFHSA
jgi:hypothetical protein